MLTKDKLLAMAKRRYREVQLPDHLGSDVARIQSLTEREKSDYEASLFKPGSMKPIRDMLASARRRLLILTLVDDQNERLLGDADEPSLLEMDGAVSSYLYDAATEHCGFQKGDVEDAVKNSGRIHGGASPTS
jgi:hypothetical protein